jgi:(R,R)-butanediol dehydrogenase/meso-butanediol dehydrogenase/diacetyl reductase
MKAARWHNVNDIRVEDISAPVMSDNDVKIKVKWCGICGSDLHEYVAGPIFIPKDTPHPVTKEVAPIAMGHEYSGVVVETGKNVTNLKVGDRVVTEPLVFCDECHPCKNGDYNTCDNLGFQGLSGFGGGFSEYTTFSSALVHKIPENISFEVGALVEPIAVAYHSLKKGNFQKGQIAVVAGAGTIGLSTVKCLLAMGASQVIMVQRKSIRQQYALEAGVTAVLDPNEVDVVEEIKKLTNGHMADVAFETTGAESVFKLLLGCIHNQGTEVITSIWEGEVTYNLNSIVLTEKNVAGTICYKDEDFIEVIDLIAEGKINTDGLITKKIHLDDIVTEGFATLTGPEKKKQVKIIVTPEKELLA